MSIADALENARRQRPVDVARVAVAICPPTSAWRIRLDRLLPDALLRLCGWQSDFARTMATERFLTFDEYWLEVGLPARLTLDAVASVCTTVRDVTYRRFAALHASGDFDVVFLVAHHARRHGIDAAEFADGPRPFADVYESVARQPAAVVLVLCESDRWRDRIVARSQHAIAAAGAPWLMPFPEALLFLHFCLLQFDGRRALDEAVDRATRAFLTRPDNGVMP
jgi:hypothetical protein